MLRSSDIQTPTLLQQSVGVTKEVAKWVKAGAPLRSADEVARLHAICKACEHWNPKGFIFWGRCNVCGCGSLKAHLETSTCKLGKWND